MKQARQIFTSDVRCFRYDIGITLLAVMAFCLWAYATCEDPGPTAFILPVTWCFLSWGSFTRKRYQVTSKMAGR